MLERACTQLQEACSELETESDALSQGNKLETHLGTLDQALQEAEGKVWQYEDWLEQTVIGRALMSKV